MQDGVAWGGCEQKNNKGKKRGLTTPGVFAMCKKKCTVHRRCMGTRVCCCCRVMSCCKKEKSGGLEGGSLLVPFPRNRGEEEEVQKMSGQGSMRKHNSTE